MKSTFIFASRARHFGLNFAAKQKQTRKKEGNHKHKFLFVYISTLEEGEESLVGECVCGTYNIRVKKSIVFTQTYETKKVRDHIAFGVIISCLYFYSF